jgi:single-stranded DNA-binding protein
MIRVEFKGYVNEVLPYEWGTVYRVSHRQVMKNHQDEWVETGRDYFSVSVSKDSQTIHATFAKDDIVEVVGRMKTKLYDKKDGSGKGIALEVRADEMRKVERNSNVNPVMQQTVNKMTATVSEMQDVWPSVKQIPDDSVPF